MGLGFEAVVGVVVVVTIIITIGVRGGLTETVSALQALFVWASEQTAQLQPLIVTQVVVGGPVC